jgi:hypothetical protein
MRIIPHRRAGSAEGGSSSDGGDLNVSPVRNRKPVWPKSLDITLIALSLAAVILAAMQNTGKSPMADNVTIRVARTEYVYPLNEDRIVHLAGSIGESIVSIENGRVMFTSSPCRDKICMGMGEVSEDGKSLACLPNRVIVTVRKKHATRN